jgi:hypothetical protein
LLLDLETVPPPDLETLPVPPREKLPLLARPPPPRPQPSPPPPPVALPKISAVERLAPRTSSLEPADFSSLPPAREWTYGKPGTSGHEQLRKLLRKHSKHFLRAENWQFTQYRRQEESTEVAPEKGTKETKKAASKNTK